MGHIYSKFNKLDRSQTRQYSLPYCIKAFRKSTDSWFIEFSTNSIGSGMANSRNSSRNANKSFRRKVESLKRQKLRERKVVSLEEFRGVASTVESHKVLVVDDDEVMRSAIKRLLDTEGYDVVLAEDGLELSKILENNHFDLILLDVNLPWVDGYELCNLIRSHPVLKAVPVIMVSAHKKKEDIERGFKAGATDYITKPFEIDHMTLVVSETLKKSS